MPTIHEQWLSRELSFNLNSRRTPLSAAQFIHNATSNVDFVRRLSLTGSLAGHDEAVHALSWSSDGRFLVTGSEDCKAKVWDAARCKAVSSFDTGHTSTIFCAKFMPGTSNEQIITASADKQVRVINLQRAAAKPYHSHRGRVRSVAPVTPFEFLSAGEDGTVRQFDSRDTPPSSRAQDWNGSYDRRSVLVDQKSEPGGKVAIYCLAMDPLRPHILATGGSDAIVRVFDRRYIPAVPVRSRAQWAYCLVPDHLVRATRTTMFAGLPVTISRLHHITGVSFSHTGQQLVASYAGEHIYSFDTAEHAQDYEAIASSVQDRYIRTSFPTNQRRGAVFASPTPPPAGPHPANRITAAALQRRAATRGGQDTRYTRPANGDNNVSLADPVQPAHSSNSAAPSQLAGGPPSPPPRPHPRNISLPNNHPSAAHATGTRPRRHVTFMAITPHAVYSQSMPMPHSAPERNAAAQPDGVPPSASAPLPVAGAGASAASDSPHSRPAATFITRSGTPHVVMRLSGPSVFARRTPSAPTPPSTGPPSGSTPEVATEQPAFPGRPNTNTQDTVTERPPGRNLPLSHRMLVLSSARRGDARPSAANERQGAGRGMSRPPLPSSIAALAAAAAALEDSLSPFTFPPPRRPQTASRNDTASSSLPSRRSTSPAPRTTSAPASSAEQGVTGPGPDATSRQPEGNDQATQGGAGAGAEYEHASKRRRLSLFPPRFTSPPPSPGAPSARPHLSHPSPTPPSNPSRRGTRNTSSSPGGNTQRAASALLPSRQNVLSMFQSWAAMSQRYLGLNRSTPAIPTSTSLSPAPDLDLPHPSSGSQHQDPSTANPAQETTSREGIVAVQTSRDHAEACSAPTSITQAAAADGRSEEALPHTDIPAEARLEIPEAASDVGHGDTAVARQVPSSRSLHPVDDSSGLEPPKTKRSRVERAGGSKGEHDDAGSDSEPEMPARIPRRRPSLFSRVLDDHPGSPEPAPPQATPSPVCGMELDSHSPAAEAPAHALTATGGEQVRERASGALGAAPRFGPVDAVADASLSLRGHLVATERSSPGQNPDVNDDTDSTHAFTTASLERDGQEQVSGFKPRGDIPPAARLIPGISAVRTIPRYPTPSLTVTATPRDPSLIGRCDLSSALSPTSSSVQRVTHTSLPVSPTSQHANYSSQLPSVNTGEEPTSLHHTNPQHSIPAASTRPGQAGEREREALHQPGTTGPTADLSAGYQVPAARHRAYGLAGQPGLSSDDIASREAVPPGKRPRHEPEPHVTSSLSLTSAPPTPTPHSKEKRPVPPTQEMNLSALRRSATAPGTAPDSSVTAGATTDADLAPVAAAALQSWSDHQDPNPAHSGSPVNVPESGLISPSRWPPSPGRSAFSLVHSPRQMQRLMLEDGSQQEAGAARPQVGAGAEPAAVGAPAAAGSVVTEAGSPPQASTSKAASKILSPSFKPPLPAPPAAEPSSPPCPTQHPNTMHKPQPAPAHATVIASPSSPTALCADASSHPRNPAFNVPHSADRSHHLPDRFLFSPPPSAPHRTRLVAGAGLTASRDGVHETARAPAITHNRHGDAVGARRRVEISQSIHRGQAHQSEGRLLGSGTALGSTSQASQEPGQGHQVGGGSSGQREGQPSQHARMTGRPRRRPSRTHVIIRVSTSFHPGGDNSDDDDDDMDGPGIPDLSSPLLSGPFFQPYMESEFHATLPFTFGAGDPEEGGDVFMGGVGVPVGGNQRREGFNRGERADGGAADDGQGSAPPGRRDAASQAGEEDGLMGRDIAGGEAVIGAGRSRNEGAMDLDEQLSMPRRQRVQDARLNAILGRIRAEIGSASMDDDERTQPETHAVRADQVAVHSTDRAGQQASHPAGPDHAAGIPAEGDGPASGPLADGRSRPQAVGRHGMMTGGAGLQAAGRSGVDEHIGGAGGGLGRILRGDRQGPESERGGWRVGEGWRAASERWRSVSPWRAASREGAWASGDGFRTGEARENPLPGTADMSRPGPSAPSSSAEQMQPGIADDAPGIPAWHQALLSDVGAGNQSHTSRRQNAASGSNRGEGGAAQPAVHVSVASAGGNSIPRRDGVGSGRPAAVDLYEYADSDEEREVGVNVDLLRAMRVGASGAAGAAGAAAAAPVRRRLGADMESGPRYPGFSPGFLTRRRGIRQAVGSHNAEQDGGEERAAASREEVQARGSEVEREAEGWPPVWERDIWSYRSRARYSEREGLWQYRSRDRPDGVLGPIMAGDAERQGEEERAGLGYRHQRTGPVLEEEDVSEEEEGQPPESGHYQQRFTGHKNQRFTKEGYKMEVSYLGPSSDFVMSGSDTGKIFIWQAKTGRLINTLQTDDVVASCVQPHPQDLCFASSGHQPVVKLWHPVAEEPAMFPLEQEGAPQPEEEANLPGLNTLLSVMQVLGHGMGEASLEGPLGPPPPPPRAGEERTTETRWTPPAREVGGECSIM